MNYKNSEENKSLKWSLETLSLFDEKFSPKTFAS